jgi:hypothetical protein
MSNDAKTSGDSEHPSNWSFDYLQNYVVLFLNVLGQKEEITSIKNSRAHLLPHTTHSTPRTSEHTQTSLPVCLEDPNTSLTTVYFTTAVRPSITSPHARAFLHP